MSVGMHIWYIHVHVWCVQRLYGEDDDGQVAKSTYRPAAGDCTDLSNKTRALRASSSFWCMSRLLSHTPRSFQDSHALKHRGDDKPLRETACMRMPPHIGLPGFELSVPFSYLLSTAFLFVAFLPSLLVEIGWSEV